MSGEEARVRDERQRRRLWRPVALLVAVVAIMVLARVFHLGDRLRELRGWIDGLGGWGPVVFVLLYIAATVAALPGSALTVVAGAIFGSVVGVVCVSVAATLGACAAFIVSRYLARDSVVQWLSENEKFRRLDLLTRDHGAVMVALTRLVPLFPFNLLNYGFGLTQVPFWTYAFWSWLCMLPGAVLYVVGADAISRAVSEGRIPVVLIAPLAGTIILLAIIVPIARKKLRAKEAETGAQTRTGTEVRGTFKG